MNMNTKASRLDLSTGPFFAFLPGLILPVASDSVQSLPANSQVPRGKGR
jgi:hypothetical protein